MRSARRSSTKTADATRWRIGEVAERFDVHAQTLRDYEREGLLRPARTRGNTRCYTQDDLDTLTCILRLTRELGVNRAGLEVILNMRARMAALQAELTRLREALAGARAEAQAPDAASGALERVAPRYVVLARGRES